VTNESNSSWGAFGITLFDSLDTLYLLGFRDDYEEAVKYALTVDFVKVFFFLLSGSSLHHLTFRTTMPPSLNSPLDTSGVF
jgi:hypothetical protein